MFVMLSSCPLIIKIFLFFYYSADCGDYVTYVKTGIDVIAYTEFGFS